MRGRAAGVRRDGGFIERRRTRFVATASLVVCACSVAAAPQPPTDIDALLTRVGERIADYLRRTERVICVERATVQPIASNWTPEGWPRTVESELRVESDVADGDALPGPQEVREVRRINGRAPRERDKKDRAGCTDPSPLSPEPLAFLLPAHRREYRFTNVRPGKERNHAALIIDFMTANGTSQPVLVEDERGHDDCFDWTGPVAMRGRVWVDATNYDVLRVDRWLGGPVSVRVPWTLQRRYNLPIRVELERDDSTMRYSAVSFNDPDEVLMLPQSTEALTVVRGGLQSTRRTWTFSGYRRFLTTGRIVR